MTEDAAVFGGLNNMLEGLENAYALYKPKMIAVSTTCMAEVIGDDLNAYIKTAKEKGVVPQDLLIPFREHPRALWASHIVGYDNMMRGDTESALGWQERRIEREDQHHSGLRYLYRELPRDQTADELDGH